MSPYHAIAAGTNKAVYFVCIASPATAPARRARFQPQFLLVNIANAASPSAAAGTSNIRFTIGNTAGESTISGNAIPSLPRAKRRSNSESDRAKVHTKGNSHSLSRSMCSPKSRMPSASQYGTTGGARTSIAGSGTVYQWIVKP